MTIENQDITVYQGDVVPVIFTITDSNNAVVDITAATFTWGLFKLATETPYVTKTLGSGLALSDAPNGKVQLNLVAVDTRDIQGDWRHELSMTLGGVIEIVATGLLTVKVSSVQ